MKMPWNHDNEMPEIPDILAQASEVAQKADQKCGRDDCEADGYYTIHVIQALTTGEAVPSDGFSCEEHLPSLLDYFNQSGSAYMLLLCPLKFGSVKLESFKQIDGRDEVY